MISILDVQAWRPPSPPLPERRLSSESAWWRRSQAPSQGGGQVSVAAAAPEAAAAPPMQQEDPRDGKGAARSRSAPSSWADREAAEVCSVSYWRTTLQALCVHSDCAPLHRQKRGDRYFAMHYLTSSGWQGFAHLGRMRYSIFMYRQSSPAGEQRREGGTCWPTLQIMVCSETG